MFSTFAAFLEMCLSEITMARLNKCNVFSHFSHSGVDDMADNTCHFGLNNLMADNGLEDGAPHQHFPPLPLIFSYKSEKSLCGAGYDTKLYFAADCGQVAKLVETVFPMPGLRFVFSVRSKTPALLKPDGTPHYGDDYVFVPGKDEVLREGTAGYIISFGDAVYRCLDAVERLKKEGVDVGLINKSTLNVVDEEMTAKVGASPMVLIVEPLAKKTGLGSRYGTYLLERGLSPKFATIGVHHEGCGGLWEQAYHQGYDSASIQKKVKEMLA